MHYLKEQAEGSREPQVRPGPAPSSPHSGQHSFLPALTHWFSTVLPSSSSNTQALTYIRPCSHCSPFWSLLLQSSVPEAQSPSLQPLFPSLLVRVPALTDHVRFKLPCTPVHLSDPIHLSLRPARVGRPVSEHATRCSIMSN